MISAPENLPMGKKPRFIKPVTTPKGLHLRLPPRFVEKYGEILPETAKLRTSSGDTWKVEIEQVAGEHGLGGGWSKFTADAGLSTGEMLEFCFNVDESTFDVLVLGINGCGRHIWRRSNHFPVEDSDPEDLTCNKHTSQVENEVEIKRDTAQMEDDDMIQEELHPSFEITLKKHHRFGLAVNKDFIKAAGLANEKAVVLEYPPNKRRWPVLFHHDKQCRIRMTSGWGDFRKRNGLVYGKTYLFEYIWCKNVIKVGMIKK